MRSAISAFLKLPSAERAIVLRACVLFPITALGVRSIGMRRTQGLLRAMLSGAAGKRASAQSSATAQRTAHLVERTAQDLRPHPQCLVRSLVLEAMLHSNGEPALLKLGARRTPAFEAHAWVELDGVPLTDDGTSTDGASFAPFTRSATPPSD